MEKKQKHIAVLLLIGLTILHVLSGCNIATVTNNGSSCSSDSKSWAISEKTYADGNVSEATSPQYRIVASNGNSHSFVHLHGDENDIVLSCEEDTVMVVLVKCKICGETTSFKKAALEKEQLEKFKCSCEGSSLLLHFYGITN